MVKNSFSINAEMEAQLKKVNNELRVLNALHRKIKTHAKRAAKRLEKDMSNELDERELKIKRVALQFLNAMASEEFEAVVNGYLPKLQLCTSYYCFINAGDFMDLSAYAEEFNSHRNNMSAKDFFAWSTNSLKSFNPKLSKTLKPIAKKAIQIVTSYTGFNFTFKEFEAVVEASKGPFSDIEVNFTLILK
ncbi:MAG: hypothetical protein K2H53_03780 [Clostridia bacterium]|nr:hypothetical protein [Clostridia bacterium]